MSSLLLARSRFQDWLFWIGIAVLKRGLIHNN